MFIRKWVKKQFRSQPVALWVLVTVAFTMWLGLGAILPIRTIYAEREGASLVEIGLMGSVFLLTQFIFQLPFGRFNDKWGRRPFILFAVVVHTILSIAYIGLNNAAWFIAIRALEGIGTAAFTPAARAYISDVIAPKKRGEAFGLFGAAISGGILLGPAVGGFIGGTFGFTMPFIFCAVSGVVGLLLAIFLLPESHQAQSTFASQSTVKRVNPFKGNLFGLFFLGAYVVMFTSQFVMSLMGTAWNIWLNDQGDSLNQIGLTYSLFGLPSLLLTPYFGRLIDRSHHRASFYLLAGVAVTFVYAGYALATGHFGWIIVLSLLESVLWAFLQPVADRYSAEIIPVNARGTGQALFSTFSTLGGFAGAMLTTYVYQFWIGAPFLLAAAVQLIGTFVGGIVIGRYERHQNSQLSKTLVESVVIPESAEIELVLPKI